MSFVVVFRRQSKKKKKSKKNLLNGTISMVVQPQNNFVQNTKPNDQKLNAINQDGSS